ncbi:Uncharacterised protein [Enterobacter hormaechei]|nr:Uncharacterised protein [Enterobacter hormaechei]SAG81243.1 Uncharacterised protein [Enterobacter hormaechei]
MLMHPQSLVAGAHGRKFRLAHGIKRALRRWPDGVIYRFPRGLPAVLHKSIIPVTEHRRQGNNAFTGFCGRSGFFLAVAVKVTVGGEDNLTGRVFLTGKARQRKKVHGRQCHHDSFPGQVMHGERGRIALRNPQALSGLFFPFDDMTCPFNLTALQGAFETVRTDKLKVNQRAGIVIQRDNHIPGAERHAAGFVCGRQYRTFPVGEALAGEVGVAAGRSGVLHEPDGQRGRRLAVSLRFSLCGRNHFGGNRRQVAGHGVHLPGSL